jgi:hypothetical protein
MLGMDLSRRDAGPGLGPVAVGGDDVAAQFMVVRVLEREPAREWSLDDTMLRDNLRQTLSAEAVRGGPQELRRSTYIEVRGS